MWLNEYFLNSWHHNCETRMKMYWKSSEKFTKCIEKFKCSWNLCVAKVNNNLEITSVRPSLDLGNKIWIGKPFIEIVFHFKNPRLGLQFLPSVKLVQVQVFLGFSSFLLFDYTSLLFRKSNPDTHYANAVYKFMREWAVKNRQNIAFSARMRNARYLLGN